jgi:putative transposase
MQPGLQKNGGDQALGRSRGGLTTKIHAAGIDESRSVALHLSAGNAGDAPAFDPLYDSLNPENVLEAIAMDKGYDSDHIRQRLELDGIEPVVSPKANRMCQYPYELERYKRRNTIERFFNKLKQFRRIATRYYKLKVTFFAAVYLAASLIALKNS